ncbi:hypothetical protein [Actinophytocola sp.]|uniref:hypothetical protein n=1 Tax=Actinophytocola sp. TaxID=1872138 RepID=UPI002D67BA8C|nr:hypothetical protein [Actinophytocola sp.]HYQ64204.1 hypothetical protein [Actinophytocola sp.]
MRIWGVAVPPGYVRWAATGAGVVVLGVLVAVAVSVSGLFGSAPEDQGTRARATVVTAAPCNSLGATETVRFTHAGKAHQARYDGCGHTRNEPVEVTVPTGPLPSDLVVHAADAATGDRENGEGLGLLLIVVSGMAGATYAFLVRRGP